MSATSKYGKVRWAIAAAIVIVLVAPAPMAGALIGGPLETCAVDPASVAAQRARRVEFSEDPTAGEWPTWWVDVDALMPPAPPHVGSLEHAQELAELRSYQLNRTDDSVQTAQSYDTAAVSTFWTDLMIHLIIEHSAKDGTKNPPRLSRQFAILESAMHDALVVTWAAKYCYQRLAPADVDPTLLPVLAKRNSPSYPSEHAAVAGVIQVLMPVFFPLDEEPYGFDQRALNVTQSRLIGGGNYRSDVEAGLAIGRAVGNAVLAARENDGSSNAAPVVVPSGPCIWQPTPPGFRAQPIEPHWGALTPFLMSTGSQFRPSPPRTCGSTDWNAQAQDVYEVSKTLTDRQKAIANYWAGGQGTETPPGMWLWVGLNQTYDHELSTMQTSRVLSHVSASLADAAIAAWDTKYTYWAERPVTTIRATLDPAWNSFIATPPFPGYMSGHSTFAGAATTTLAYFFPDAAVELSAYATEAAMSRYYGGIHIRSDNEIGLVVGSNIGGLAIQRAQQSE